MVQDDAVTEALYAREPAFRRSVEYLSRNASAPLYCNTQSEYYPMGQDFFARFLEVIRGAKKYIFMEYFIVEEGEMWNETLAVLKEKAAAGVDVRRLGLQLRASKLTASFTLVSANAAKSENMAARLFSSIARACRSIMHPVLCKKIGGITKRWCW